MSKKHYIAIARTLNHHYRQGVTENEFEVRQVVINIAHDLAIVLLRDNPRFDKGRFMKAVREGI